MRFRGAGRRPLGRRRRRRRRGRRDRPADRARDVDLLRRRHPRAPAPGRPDRRGGRRPRARRSRSSRCCTSRTAGSCRWRRCAPPPARCNRLVQRAVEAAGDGPVSVAVHHLAAAERADRLAGGAARAAARPCASCTSASSAPRSVRTSGPGAVGVVVAPFWEEPDEDGDADEAGGATEPAMRTHMRGSLRLEASGGAARRPQVAVRIHRSVRAARRPAAGSLASGRCASPPAAATTPTSSARACGPCSRRRNRARGWLPDDDLVAGRTADDGTTTATRPRAGRRTGPRRAGPARGPGRHRAPEPTARWDPGRPGARSLWVAGLAAALLLVAGRGWTGPRSSPAPVTAGGERAIRTSRPQPSVGEVAETSADGRRVGRRIGGAARAWSPCRRAPAWPTAVEAAGGLLPEADPAVGQPRRRRHRRPADRRGCSRAPAVRPAPSVTGAGGRAVR